MQKELTKENVTKNKDKAICNLNTLLETLINDSYDQHLKKANLISYWLNNYVMYINAEETFSTKNLIRYNRGNIIRVNLGFNVGKEFGGLHYAVVVDNDNKRNADVLTIIPLSSTDGRTVHERNVNLGAELYEKAYNRQKKLLDNASKELEDFKTLSNSLCTLVNTLVSVDCKHEDLESQLHTITQTQEDLKRRKDALESYIENLKQNNLEISKMKHGSMALVNQIRTVSKQRIYTPKKSEDFFYSISLSPSAMDKINLKMKELFIFDK